MIMIEQLEFGIIKINQCLSKKVKRSVPEEKLYNLRHSLEERVYQMEQLLSELDPKSQGYFMVEGSLLAYMAVQDMIDERRER